MILKSLDDRLVPRMAAGLRRLLDSATPGRSRAAAEPAGRSGVLGLLRDVPQLAALLAAVVFLAVAGAYLLARSGDDRVTGTAPAPASSASPPPAAATGSVLGPPEGTEIDAYLARAAARTAQLAAQDGAERTLALVSLTDYLTPQAAADQLAGVDVRRAYLRAPSAGDLAEVREVPVPSDLVATLRASYATTAAAKQEDAEEFQGLADSIEATSPEEAEAKQAYVVDAARASAEASAYAMDCACVLAVVVEGTPSELAELAAAPGVRGVEPADPGARLEALQVFPLRPEHTGVVPPPPVPGGPTIPGEDGQ